MYEVDDRALLSLHLSDGIDVVLVTDLGLAEPQRDHASLDTDGLELGAAELVRGPGQLGPVDVAVDLHLAGVDPQDLGAALLVRQRELDLAIEPAGAQQGRVQHVDPVRGRQDLDPVVRREAVHLVEQLQHRPLHLPVPGLFRVEALGAHRVELVDEDDRRRLLLCQREAVSH